MLRRLMIAGLEFIVVLVIAIDRVGAHVAAHVLAGKLESDEHLSSRPAVSINGIPFLTQAFGGDYHDVDVTAHNIVVPGDIPVTTLKAHLHDAHIPFSKVISGSVKQVPVDRVDGTAYLSFPAISRYAAGKGLSITLSRASAHTINVVGQLSVAGGTRVVRSVVTVGVSGSVVTLSGATGALGRAFAPALPLRGLPFRITFTSATVSAGGVTAAGRARRVTFGS
jgi:hypothetical protein